MKQKEIKVIHRNDQTIFEDDVNFYLAEGWQLHSSFCGFINSESYDFVPSYHAIMIKIEEL